MENSSRPGTPDPEGMTLSQQLDARRKELEARHRERDARRKARRRRQMVARFITLALAFIAGMALGYALRAGQEPAQAANMGATTPHIEVEAIDPAIFVTCAPPMDNPRELWSIEHGQEETPLLDVDLDPVTQWGIYAAACDRDPALFCAVMAIAWTESRFQPDTVGDDGNSLGMMQINTKYHRERMEALGITDLTDPIQSAVVAADYLKEIEGLTGATTDDPLLYMAYNMGPAGARKALLAGTESTEYSDKVLATYRGYREQMEWAGDE